jgi:hypothetical protein
VLDLKTKYGGTRKMNTCKTLIAILAISLSGVAAFGQNNNRTPADTYGPVRPTSGSINPRIPASGAWNDSSIGPNAGLTFNAKLTDRLKTMLPQGANLHVESRGFIKLKDFVTTVRAANNLNVPFWDLKRKMANGSSKELQKAIHELKPDADPKAELKKADEQAKRDIKESKQS